MTRYIPSSRHRRDTEHLSLPLLLSLTTTSERVTYAFPLCSQPRQVLGFRLHATHQPTTFPPLMRQGLDKPALPASKGYLHPSKLLTHPVNSRLTTTSSEKRLSTFQIKWLTLCWVPSHSGLVHKKQSIVISEVFSSARQYLHRHTGDAQLALRYFINNLINSWIDTNSGEVLKCLKAKAVSFSLPGTRKTKWGLKNVVDNNLDVHRVAVSPHERDMWAAAWSPVAL